MPSGPRQSSVALSRRLSSPLHLGWRKSYHNPVHVQHGPLQWCFSGASAGYHARYVISFHVRRRSCTYSRVSCISSVAWPLFYSIVSFVEWRDESSHFVRIKNAKNLRGQNFNPFSRWKSVENLVKQQLFLQTTSTLILIDTPWFKPVFECIWKRILCIWNKSERIKIALVALSSCLKNFKFKTFIFQRLKTFGN